MTVTNGAPGLSNTSFLNQTQGTLKHRQIDNQISKEHSQGHINFSLKTNDQSRHIDDLISRLIEDDKCWITPEASNSRTISAYRSDHTKIQLNKAFLKEITAQVRDKGVLIYLKDIHEVAMTLKGVSSLITKPSHVGILIGYNNPNDPDYYQYLIPVVFFLHPQHQKTPANALILAGAYKESLEVQYEIEKLIMTLSEHSTSIFTGRLESLYNNDQHGNILLLKHILRDLQDKGNFHTHYSNILNVSTENDQRLGEINIAKGLPLEWTFGQDEVHSSQDWSTYIPQKKCYFANFRIRNLATASYEATLTAHVPESERINCPPIGHAAKINGVQITSKQNSITIAFTENRVVLNYLTGRVQKEISRIAKHQETATNRQLL